MKNRIREVRKEQGITLDKLAELSGVSRSTISRYENEKDKISPSVPAMEKLAKALNVSSSYLQGVSFDPVGLDDTITETMTVREFEKFVEEFKQGKHTREAAEKVLASYKKSVDAQLKLGQFRVRTTNQLMQSIESLDLEKMDTFEMMNINDSIQLCISFHDKFYSDKSAFSSFSALISSMRSIVKSDGQVDYDKAEFMNAFEQFLDTVVAKQD